MPQNENQFNFVLGDLTITNTELKKIGKSLKVRSGQKESTIDIFLKNLKFLASTTTEQVQLIQDVENALYEKFGYSHYGSSLKNKWIDKLDPKNKKHLKYLEKSRPLGETSLDLCLLDFNIAFLTALRWQDLRPQDVISLINDNPPKSIKTSAGMPPHSSLNEHLNTLREQSYGKTHLETIKGLTDEKLYNILKLLHALTSFTNPNDIMCILELSKTNPFFMYFVFCFEEELIANVDSPVKNQVLSYFSLKSDVSRVPREVRSTFAKCNSTTKDLDLSDILNALRRLEFLDPDVLPPSCSPLDSPKKSFFESIKEQLSLVKLETDIMLTSVSTVDQKEVKVVLREMIYISIKEAILNGIHLFSVINSDKDALTAEDLEQSILQSITNMNLGFVESIHAPTLKTAEAYTELITETILHPNLKQFQKHKERITEYLTNYKKPFIPSV